LCTIASYARADDAPSNIRRAGNSAAAQVRDAEETDKEDKTAKMGLEELRDQLRKAKREVINRDTTLRALQRNYETLASVHEEGKAEHQRRKIAFDQIRW
jgi:flagellar motility protein MotE (MotC chaperone)